jgi:CBS domain containing-hemolysin-like protein
VLGFVHVKDILGYSSAQRSLPIPAELIRPLAVVSPDRSLADLLLAMRRDRLHIVLVSDGQRPLGVITLDDVIHAVVGEPAHVAAPLQPTSSSGR